MEDHETAILELERVVLSISELVHKVVLTGTMKAEFEHFRHATLSQCNDTKWQTLEEVEGKFKHLTGAIIPSRVLSTRWRHDIVTGACYMTRLMFEVGHRLRQLEAWADEVAGDDGCG